MATITGTHVNFVKVPTMAKFNDITTKVDGTVYFIVDAKKIYLDGVMYGFNDSDIDLSPYLKHDGSVAMGGTLDFNKNNLDNVYQIMSGDKGGAHDIIEFNDGGIGFNIHDEDGELPSWIQFSNYGIHMSGDVFLGIYGLTPLDDMVLWNTDSDSHAVSIETLKNIVTSKRGVANGFASLDSTGRVPSAQLPSFVDDVLEYSNKASFPPTGEGGKLYIDLSNNNVWRWGGSAYINVSDGNAHLQLGTTSSTAYRGDHGLAAYNHRTTTNNPHSVTKSQVGLGSVENYGLASKAQAEAGSSNTVYMTPQRTKEAIETLAPKLSWTVVA